jgi:hypothetical protein
MIEPVIRRFFRNVNIAHNSSHSSGRFLKGAWDELVIEKVDEELGFKFWGFREKVGLRRLRFRSFSILGEYDQCPYS